MPKQAEQITLEELRGRIRDIEQGRGCASHEAAVISAFGSSAESAPGATSCKQQRSRRTASRKRSSSEIADGTYTEEQAFRKIERLACMREHASKALLARLQKDGFAPDVAEAAVNRAQRCGLISDDRFADVLVRSRLSQGKGLQGIAAELSSLDIDPYNVEAYLQAGEQSDGPDELARALSLLDAKPPRGKHLRESAYRKLMQKGYGASVSASAARIWSEEHSDGERQSKSDR